MLRIDGPRYRLCDGISRRQLLEGGSISALGLSLPALLAARASATSGPTPHAPSPPEEKGSVVSDGGEVSCIMLWLWGAPSYLDTCDMKPEQPAEIRGPWKSIPTSAPGIRVCEHLPRFAGQMHRITQVRTMFNDAPDHPEGAAISLS